MANRYTYTKTLNESETNKSYMETTIYPNIKAADNDFYIISEATDRLDLLANKYYGNPRMWWIIAVANNLNDANLFVQPGIQLRIPQNTSVILNTLDRINK
jgi:hypothetical protein